MKLGKSLAHAEKELEVHFSSHSGGLLPTNCRLRTRCDSDSHVSLMPAAAVVAVVAAAVDAAAVVAAAVVAVAAPDFLFAVLAAVDGQCPQFVVQTTAGSPEDGPFVRTRLREFGRPQ